MERQAIPSFACDMNGCGYPLEEALRLLLHCDRPRTDRERAAAEATIRSAYAQDRRAARWLAADRRRARTSGSFIIPSPASRSQQGGPSMSPEPQHPGNPAEGQGGLVVHWEKATKTKTLVQARFDGTLVHSHALDLNSGTARASYAQRSPRRSRRRTMSRSMPASSSSSSCAAIDAMAAQAVGRRRRGAGPPEYLAV